MTEPDNESGASVSAQPADDHREERGPRQREPLSHEGIAPWSVAGHYQSRARGGDAFGNSGP